MLEKEVTYKLTLILTEKEAEILRAMVQNPFGDELERAVSKKIFDELRDL